MPITKEELEGAMVVQESHYNLGYVDNPNGGPPLFKGGGFGYRFEKYPRLYYINYTYELEERFERHWFVDGVRVESYDAAIRALNLPAAFTDEELDTLRKIPNVFVDLSEMWDVLAGVPHPEGAIMPDTPHARVMDLIHALRDKGAIEYGKDHEPPAGGWDDLVPGNMRWSPTIRCKNIEVVPFKKGGT